jgi:gluconokinase
MGVSGCGKSTVAAILARRLGCPIAEADDFHTPANIAKMSAGTPLTDADRWPWLGAIRDWLNATSASGSCGIVTCSALKRRYRDLLRGSAGGVCFLHLTNDPATLAERLEQRAGHFMPASMLASQLEALEALEPDEMGIVLANDTTPDDLARRAIAALGLSQVPHPLSINVP